MVPENFKPCVHYASVLCLMSVETCVSADMLTETSQNTEYFQEPSSTHIRTLKFDLKQL